MACLRSSMRSRERAPAACARRAALRTARTPAGNRTRCRRPRRRRRKEAALDRAIDDLERFDARRAAPARVSGMPHLAIAAGRRARSRAAPRHRPADEPARAPASTAPAAATRAAADDQPSLPRYLAGLVVGDAQRAGAPCSSTRSIEPRSWNRPSMATGSAAARGDRARRRHEAEAPARTIRRPLAAGLAHPSQPQPQVARDRARSRRARRDRSPAPAARGSRAATSRDRLVEHRAARVRGRRRAPAARRRRLQLPVERRLDRVEEAAARQRIEPLQRLGSSAARRR